MEIEMKPVSSSNIAAIGYDEESQEMRVEFLSGTTYSYAGIPPELHEALINSSSIGSSFHSMIKKGGFNGVRV